MSEIRGGGKTTRALDMLRSWGFSSETQGLLGAFILMWGMFEANLEETLWVLRKEDVAGTRPWTDTVPLGEWLKELGKGWEFFSSEVNEILTITSSAAHDLMEYRHAIIHGHMLPHSETPSFIRNPGWHGVLRGRPSHDAHVDENLLDMAIQCVFVFCQVIFSIRGVYENPETADKFLSLKKDVMAAQSMANELRHLTELMNHEKY
jgi:hypothetical protein